MKTKHKLIGLLIMTMPMVSLAQIGGSIFDNVKMDSTERKTLKGTYDFFSKEFTDFDGDTMVERCFKLMGDHAEKLTELQDQIENTDNCKKRKELLEYQALLLLTAGTKLFCPDELNSDKPRYAIEILQFIKPLSDFLIENRKISVLSMEEKFKVGPAYYEKMMKELRSNTELYEITELVLKFKKAEEKFGNPYTNRYNFVDWLISTEEEYIRNLEADIKDLFNPIDYFTYTLNPAFIVKVTQKIDVMRRSLDCD